MTVISNTKTDKNTVELLIRVGAEEFEPAVDRAYKKNAPKITMPGFRPGKAPRAMIEKAYGTVFLEDALNELYPTAYNAAVLETGIEAVDRAEIDVVELTKEGFTFKATVTVRPEVTIKNYKGLSAAKAEPSVSAEEVEKTVNQLRERAGRIVTVEDKPAALGDTTVIDFEGFVGDVAFDGGSGQNFSLALGSGQFIPGFEEQLVGKKAGDECDVKVTFPEAYHAEDLAGKEAVFKVKVHEVKVKELPELDDEFAKDVSEFDTLAELKADIEAKLLENSKDKCEQDFENELVDAVVELMEADIPDCMIEQRMNDNVNDFANRLAQQGLNMETYLSITGGTIEDFRETHRPNSERQVKMRLALEEIARIEKFEVPAERMEEEYEKIAKMYNMELENVKAAIAEDELKKDLEVTMAIEYLKDNAKVKKAEKTTKAAKAKAADEGAAEEKPKKKTATKKAAAKKEDSAEGDNAEEKPKTARKPKAAKEPKAE